MTTTQTSPAWESGYCCQTCYNLYNSADIGLGIALVYAILLPGQDWIASEFGLFVELNLLNQNGVYVVLLVALFGCLVGLIPGIRMHRYSLADGMTVRV